MYNTLNIGELHIEDIVNQFGTPCYIYSERIIEEKLNLLKEHFKGFDIFYSFKANPNPHICRFIKRKGHCADAASIGELKLALQCGFQKDEIIYSAPGKTEKDIEKALGKGIIIADSLNELRMINEICIRRKVIEDIAVRINPVYSIEGPNALEIMSGLSSKFGIDQETLSGNIDFINSLSHIHIKGIQIYMGSQITNYQIIYSNFLNIFKVALFCKKELGLELDFIDFGGGFGIQYTEDDPYLNIKKAGELVQKLKESNDFKELSKLRHIIESGRFICGPAGIYVSKVVDTKESRGKKYAILEGGMNTFFRPVFIKENCYPVVVINKANEVKKEKVTLAGVMCTPLDIFEEDVLLPILSKGDLIAFFNAGAYGYTMSLTKFISHNEAKEVYVTKDKAKLENEGDIIQ